MVDGRIKVDGADEQRTARPVIDERVAGEAHPVADELAERVGGSGDDRDSRR